VVLIPHTNLAGAQEMAEHIRHAFEAAPFDIGDGQAIPLTCSIGVAEFGAGETPERFIERADAALYRAKQGGRNRVVAAESPGET
jgi:two-component system cell cycle response regulator